MNLNYRIKSLDWGKWYRNTMTFIAPLAIIYLLAVITNVNLDGVQITDFVPSDVVIGAMALYILNVLLDFFRKFSAVK